MFAPSTYTVLVHEGAEFFHAGFKHAVGGGIGDHHGGEIGAVLLAFRPHIDHIHITLRIAGHDDDLHAHHLRAGRVGAMGAGGNQADFAMALAARFLPCVDHEQACVFALRAGIGLQADAAVACGLAEPFAQLLVHQRIAFTLIGGAKRMDIGKLRPCDGDHLARCVELHGA
jgi:hypothetical protein